jgi:hypothetical protein
MSRPLRGMVAFVVVAATLCAGPAWADARLSPCYSDDNGDPTLTSLDVSPAIVDVTAAPARLKVSATVADSGGPGPATGVRSVVLELSHSRWDGIHRSDVRLEASDGVWSGTYRFIRGERNGEYRLRVRVVDGAKNTKWYAGDELEALGVPAAITVVSEPDRRPPRLHSIEFKHRHLDTRQGPRWQTLTLRMTDERTGIARVEVELDGGLGIVDLRRTPDDSDLFHRRLRIPVWLTTSTYVDIDGIVAWDRLGNYRVWNELDKTNWARESRFFVKSRLDLQAPTASRLVRSRRTVDVRRQPRPLTISAPAQDLQAGVARVEVDIYRVQRWSRNVVLRRVEGTARDGWWRRELVIDGCGWDPGRYRFQIVAEDEAGNIGYRASKHVVVLSRERQRPHFQTFDRSLAPGEPLHVLFDEAVGGIDLDNAVISRRADGSPVPGVWRCRDEYTDDVGCRKWRVRSATFIPTDPWTPGRVYLVELNPEHRLGMTDRHGNPFDRARDRFRVEES